MPIVAPCMALVLALSPGEAAVAAPAAVVVDRADVDAAASAGQVLYDAGEHLSAARTWTAAARRLPPTPEQRGDLVALHGLVADAYDQAGKHSDDPALLREALAVLDEQDARLAAAYPDLPPAPRVTAARERLQARLAVVADRPSALAPIDVSWNERPQVRPWRPLQIGGGFALAGGLAMSAVFVVGLVRAKHYENGFQSSALGCQVQGADGACGDYYDDYRAASAMTLAGLILGPALLGTGATLLVVAARRKRAAQPEFTPVVARGFYGLAWQRRF